MPAATLFRYIALRTIFAVAAMLTGLGCLVILVDLVESLRFAGKFEATFWDALSITLMRAPSIVLLMLPFIFLFASIWLFSELNRRAEVAVMRSAGLSVWRLLGPAAFVAVITGFLVMTVIDPATTHLLAQSEILKDKLSGKSSSIVRVFGDGIWLHQREADNVLIINARSFDPAAATLSHVVIWRLDGSSVFIERVDAPEARLSGHTIELKDALVKEANARVDHRSPIYAVPTALTPDDLRERVDNPESLSLWRLPRFILLAKAAGLPTVRYNLRFHELCSTPLKLLAMVLIAAMFSLRPIRSGGAFKLLLFAIAAGFALYVISEIFTALGESGIAPVALAAWAPALIALLTASTGLLYMEEG